MWRFVIALFFACISAQADARGGGHYTGPFDASLFPGAALVKNFITDYSATCNGVASDDTARTTWLTDAVAANPSLVVLYIPPGKNCNFPSGGGLTDGVQNFVVWGYGASWNSAFIGAASPWQDTNTKSAKVQTVSAGASSVTLVSAGDAAIFSVGDNVAVGCLSMQSGGYPPNLQFFSYHVISSIVGGVISLGSPTIPDACKSTYPQTNAGDVGHIGPLGPAVIYQLKANFKTNGTFYGLKNTYPGQACVEGKTIALIDVDLSSQASSCVTMADTVSMSFTHVVAVEADKEVNLWSCYRCSIGQIDGQSSSMKKLSLISSTLGALNGSVRDLDVINTAIGPGTFKFGPTGFGHGGVVNWNGSSIAACTGIQPAGGGAACGSAVFVSSSPFSFSGGVLSVADTDPIVTNGNVWRTFVPGQKYYFGDSDGTNNSSPQTTFMVTDISDNGTTTSVTTDIAGSLPAPTCGGHACSVYGSYQASTVTQINSPGMSVNLVPYAPP